MEKLDKNIGIDEELKKGLEATEQVSVEKLEAGLKEKHEQTLSDAEKKKEEIWQQIKDEVKRVEAGVGDTRGTEEEAAEAKQGGDELKNKEAAAEGELKSTLDIVMEKYKTEAPPASEKELRSTLDIAMEKYKAEASPVSEKKLEPTDTVTEKDILEKRAEEAKQALEVEQKVGAEKPKEGVVEDAVLKGVEGEKLRRELDEARKAFALVEKNDPKYAEVLKGYQEKKEAMQNFAHEAKKATLLKKGLSEADTETELSKYAREVLAPNFAVAEAAKIQDERVDETMLEKVKDSKVSQMIYGVVDKYRKMGWKQKLALSAGLFGGALVAGTAGGAIGAAIGGGVGIAKLTQRILGGAGTAVGTEAMIQKSQQKWMEKEGWGKNRKEYVANEIQRLREGVKKGEVSAESLEEAGVLEEVEKALEERKDMEDKFEQRRTILAGIVGGLVGSGAVTQAVKQYWEWSGAKNLIFGAPKEIPEVEKAKEVASAAKEQVKAAVAPIQEKIVPVAIGARGPEGALIDNFKAHPDVARAFGWDGKADLSKWAGSEAHKLWEADAKEALKNPKILAQMENLGFSKDADGYAKMAHRIGFIQIDPTDKHIKFTDMEYLKNATKELKIIVEQPTPEVPAIVRDLVYQQKLFEMESKMTPHLEEIIKGLKENGMSEEKIAERMEFIAKAAAERAGVDLSALGKDVINVDALQQIMESPEGKLGAFLEKFSSGLQEGVKVFKGNINFQKTLELVVEEKGGWAKLLKEKNFFDIVYPSLPEGGRVVTEGEIVISEFYNQLTALVPARTNLIGKSLEDILKLVPPKEIFGGTAEELMEKK